MPSSWRSSRPRDQDCIVSCIGRSGSSPLEPPGKLCALCPRPSFLGPAYRCPSSSLVQMGTSLWGEQRLSPLAGSSQDLELENTMIVFALPETFPSQTFPVIRSTWPFQDILFHGQTVLRVRKFFLGLSEILPPSEFRLHPVVMLAQITVGREPSFLIPRPWGDFTVVPMKGRFSRGNPVSCC